MSQPEATVALRSFFLCTLCPSAAHMSVLSTSNVPKVLVQPVFAASQEPCLLSVSGSLQIEGDGDETRQREGTRAPL
jgi:hypothetical protein